MSKRLRGVTTCMHVQLAAFCTTTSPFLSFSMSRSMQSAVAGLIIRVEAVRWGAVSSHLDVHASILTHHFVQLRPRICRHGNEVCRGCHHARAPRAHLRTPESDPVADFQSRGVAAAKLDDLADALIAADAHGRVDARQLLRLGHGGIDAFQPFCLSAVSERGAGKGGGRRRAAHTLMSAGLTELSTMRTTASFFCTAGSSQECERSTAPGAPCSW